MKIDRIFVILFSLLFIFSFNIKNIRADTKTFIKEYTYQASDADSKISCRTIALEQVKRLLLEELGTYLEGETEVSNFQLTKDKIIMLTAGITKVNVLEEKWDGFTYAMKAEISVDPDELARSIDDLRQDRQKMKELEETRKMADGLLAEVEKLKKELELAKADTTIKEQQQFTENIRRLDAVGSFENGYASNLSGDYDSAIKSFDKATELYPQFSTAFNNRGEVYMNSGNYEMAIRDYSTAIMLSPLYTVAYLNRGVAYTKLGDYKTAVVDYNKAIKIDPHYAHAYYQRGDAYRNIGQFRRATSDFGRSITLNPSRADAYRSRGDTYTGLGKKKEASQDYLKARELSVQQRTVPLTRQINVYGTRTNTASVSPGVAGPGASVVPRTPAATGPLPRVEHYQGGGTVTHYHSASPPVVTAPPAPPPVAHVSPPPRVENHSAPSSPAVRTQPSSPPSHTPSVRTHSHGGGPSSGSGRSSSSSSSRSSSSGRGGGSRK